MHLMIKVNRWLLEVCFSVHFWSLISKSAISWCRISCTYFRLLWLAVSHYDLNWAVLQWRYHRILCTKVYTIWTLLYTTVVKDVRIMLSQNDPSWYLPPWCIDDRVLQCSSSAVSWRQTSAVNLKCWQKCASSYLWNGFLRGKTTRLLRSNYFS